MDKEAIIKEVSDLVKTLHNAEDAILAAYEKEYGQDAEAWDPDELEELVILTDPIQRARISLFSALSTVKKNL